jgi:hypothetical protein
MTVKDIMEIRGIFAKRRREVYSVSLGLKIVRFLKKTEDVEAFYLARQEKIFEECLEKDENGAYIPVSGGYKLRADKIEEYQKKLLELHGERTEDTVSFSEEDAEALKLSVEELRIVSEFLEV